MKADATDFDAVALMEHLATLSHGQLVAQDQLVAYRGYYDLTFTEGVPAPIRHKMYCLDLDDDSCHERIVVQHFLPTQPNSYAMFLHGYFDHVGLFSIVIRALLKRNIAVVCYDQIGHGLSTGARAVIDDFDHYVAATDLVFEHTKTTLPEAACQRWHWVGQSMGGAIIMEYLQRQKNAQSLVGEIVLFAPLVRPYAWWINRWIFRAAQPFVETRPRVITNNADNPEFIARQRIDPLAPQTLSMVWITAMVSWYRRFVRYPTSQLAPRVIQGDADRTVDWRFGLKTYKRRYPNHIAHVVPGGRHHLANESSQVQTSMWSFLDETCRW